MAPSEADLYIGRDLDARWRVDSPIGEGHFSVVMAAVDLQTGEQVAVKILKLNSGVEAEEEMRDEIGYLGTLQSCDRVVDLRGSGEDVIIADVPMPVGGTMKLPLTVRYLVLERAESNLADLLVGLDSVAWPERLALFRDVVKGVHQMHLKRIVSRDLKSDNVLLFVDGFVTTAKVADLGRARCTAEPARRAPGEYLTGRGDFRFAPPEVFWWQGVDDVEHWAAIDLFHLGSVLYELVTGHGITSIVLPNSRNILQTTFPLSADARQADFVANLAPLRAQMSLAWEPFEAALPKVIRPQLTALLKQLTDPDPMLRSPRVLGRPVTAGRGLEWLLRRSDILRRTLVNGQAQADRTAHRKLQSNGAA